MDHCRAQLQQVGDREYTEYYHDQNASDTRLRINYQQSPKQPAQAPRRSPLPEAYMEQSFSERSRHTKSNYQHVDRSFKPYREALRTHISALSLVPSQTHSVPESSADLQNTRASAVTQTNNVSATGDVSHSHIWPRGMAGPTPSRGSEKLRNVSQIRQDHATHPDPIPPNNSGTSTQTLTTAIRQGISPSKASSQSATPKLFAKSTVLRMPFQDEPGSPSSIYTEGAVAQNNNTMPLSIYHDYDPRISKRSTVTEQEIEDCEKFGSIRDAATPLSHVSAHPIITKDGNTLSDRVPASKRPPKLNIGAVREAEARGSMTSLSDLIRRATRVASNLDRGRTASRLGHLDMFSSSEKLDRNKARNSTYSDVLAAFPPPADGVATPSQDRPTTMWPTSAKQFMASKSSLGQHGDGTGSYKHQRQCCGLSPTIFISMVVLLVLLVAAAVLVPMFLILMPKQHQRTLGECSSLYLCRNEGVTVTTNKQCSCICMNGFTGSDCSREGDPECITASLQGAMATYNNATIGTAISPILQSESRIHGIPLNTTMILATFAANNLSCASENSLVVFAGSSNRFVKRSSTFTKNSYPHGSSRPFPSNEFEPRQDVTQSTNGIVFATSSQEPQITATSGSASVAPTATGSSQRVIGNDTLNFAAAVVLYVLQSHSEINIAVNAKQAMTAYFEEANPTNHTIVVVDRPQQITVNFETLELDFANGTRLGDT